MNLLSSWHWSTPPGPIMLGAFLVVALGTVVEYAMFGARLGMPSRRLRATCATLRLLGLAGLAAVLGGLARSDARLEQTLRRVVILADNTRSMQIKDAAADDATPTPRRTRAERLWTERAGLEAWAADEGIVLDWRPLDDGTADIFDPARPFETATGQRSALDAALARLHDPAALAPLAGVLVISDGLSTEGGPAPEATWRAAATQLGVPISTVAVGGAVLNDGAVTALRVGEFGFVENTLEFEVDVRIAGSDPVRAQVELWMDDQRIEQRTVVAEGGGRVTTVPFQFVPDQVGQTIFSARLLPLADEPNLQNNEASRVVKILRDRVRALHVAGRPDWDVRALRTLLRNDANVELLSYYILRDFDDIERAVSNERMSLIPFPVDELFMEKLDTFDLIIMQNFDARTHGRYLDNIRAFVLNGGAFVIIGGDLGLPSADFAPLADILPVDSRGPAPLSMASFLPRLTDAGTQHPITRWLAQDDTRPLPTLTGYNETELVVEGPRQDTRFVSLLEHPTARGPGGGPVPILALALAGKGRVLVLNTPSSWRLGFSSDLQRGAGGGRPYDRLWRSALRWLLQDDGAERLVLETDATRYAPGAPIELRLKTLSANYALEPKVPISWTIRALDDGHEEAADLTTSGPRGAALVTHAAPTTPGNYVATAVREDTTDPVHDQEKAADSAARPQARRVFQVTDASREFLDLSPTNGAARLKALAQATGGRFVDASSAAAMPDDVPVAASSQRTQTGAHRWTPAWPSLWVLLCVALGFGGEWLLRRRAGAR